MKQLDKAKLWKALEEHALLLQTSFTNPKQFSSAKQKQFNASTCNIHLDYSHQHLTTKTLELLFELADACCLRDKTTALMRGDDINFSENKPALHTALRAPTDTSTLFHHQNIMQDLIATRKKIRVITEQIRNKNWLGYSGKPISDIVNIGIGGSDLGPRFAIKALEDFVAKDLGYHFISDADPRTFKNTVAKLSPETTLFIVASKSFTTQETLYNARKAMDWIGAHNNKEKHFIAVTTNEKQAQQFGIRTIIPLWDSIGGRYSFCSAINLITAIGLGCEQFNQLLEGAYSMDQHFQNSDYATNLPVLLALIGIWNNNFLGVHSLLIWTYSQLFRYFVPYIQQLDMESNGKSIDNQGNTVPYATAPLIWGGMGNQAQHSYYQLLCQGTHKVAADFISLDALRGEIINNVCDAKINVLTANMSDEENQSLRHQTPLNHIRLSHYSPFTIGALTALYEHKVFTQSVIWDINPFDQPGVESAKRQVHRRMEEKIHA